MRKLKINMYAGGLNIEGQGVGSNFFEQVSLVKKIDGLDISVNGKHPKDYDICHFHTVNPSFYFKFRKDVINVCYVHFIPDKDDGSLKMPGFMFGPYKWYVLRFYRKADEVIVVNPYYMKSLEEIGIPKDRITYIPNYVSNEEFHPMDKKGKLSARREFGLREDVFTVLGVGQTQTRKGVLDFAEVAKRNPDMQFVWAGGFSFGKITSGYSEIKALMDNPPANLRFLGIVPRAKMNEVFNAADMLFLPSYQELFPMTLLECINVELPFLVRDLDLYKDIFLSPYTVGHDNGEFAEIIKRLRDDEGYYEEVRKQSLAIRDFYSEGNVKKLWDGYYHRIYDKYPDKHRIK